MPVTQSGDNASLVVHGTINDVGRDQYNTTYNYSTTPISHREATLKLLQNLEPASMDATHREECLAGTRTEINEFVVEWVKNTDGKRAHNVLLILGVAGSGKSTLSTTIANRMNTMGRLATFLSFERDVSNRSDPSTVVRTLAYNLGLSQPTVGEVIAQNVEKYPEVTRLPLRSQFQHLLVQPMTSEGVMDSASPVVFVLDALDECGTPDTRETLLELLAEQSIGLPALFVITSRPLRDICGFFNNRNHVLVQELDITAEHNNDDITRYLKHRMRRIRKKFPSLHHHKNWPGNEALRQLVNKASGLFIWASTASKFIDQHPPNSRLEIIIQGTSAPTAEHALDSLYRTALEAAGSWDIPEFVTDFRAALGFILIARRPVPGKIIISLLGNTVTESCIDVISQLACVLQLDPTIRLLHPSFADFLFDPQRCVRGDYFFEKGVLHHSLALMCLKRLDAVLKENTFDLTLSPSLVQIKVPGGLAYASMYWIEHVCMANNSAMIPTLHDFLRRHLLHWVEVMSVLSRTRTTMAMLEQLSTWLSTQAEVAHELSILVDDGVRFIRRHVDLIERHPLLVYSSALPFTPPESLLYKTFHDPARHPITKGLEESSWSPLLQVLSGHKHLVSSIGFSPDGSQIISGSDDKTIRVWNASSGVEILSPLRGHRSMIRSVTFSPDGTRIASGSNDRSVRLWDASSGVQLLSPMKGHTTMVNSVIFSPDGKLIISGSNDKTIRKWDAESGAEIGQPLKGHKDGVRSISVSPDGTRIASGSYDKTVRVWDITSGEEVLAPLQSHTDSVISVSFSPDGRYIASGSSDTTICLWSSDTGGRILVLSHSDWVWSVAFSPDGTRIISSSHDRTIRVWSVTTGIEVIPRFVYNDSLICVSPSPDGTRIASGSRGGTVQIWDVTSSLESFTQHQGHANSIRSLTFSPDGNRIASRDSVNIVCVMDTTSGAQLPPCGVYGDSLPVGFSSNNTTIGNIYLNNDGWIVDRNTEKYLSKLPSIFRLSMYCNYERSLGVGDDDGRVVVMHFPADS